MKENNCFFIMKNVIKKYDFIIEDDYIELINEKVYSVNGQLKLLFT